jgi:hypothetical protein
LPTSTRPLPTPALKQRFRRNLLAWYRKNGRDLPWRNTDDPYHILVSEIMLQQTQVDRVLPKYHEWLKKYPSFAVLAEAPPAEVSHTWRPLGYNIRPKRLQSIAQQAVSKVRRQAAERSRHAPVLPRHRRVHRRRDPQLRLPRARRHSRHQRCARALQDLRRQRRSKEPRDEESTSGPCRRRAAAQARLRLQPGADGLRRDALQRAQAEVPDLFYEGLLPISCSMRSRSASGNGSDANSDLATQRISCPIIGFGSPARSQR